MAPLSGAEEAFLRAWSRAALTVPRALDADLLIGQGMSLSDYSALMHLSEAPGRSLRMSELASAIRDGDQHAIQMGIERISRLREAGTTGLRPGRTSLSGRNGRHPNSVVSGPTSQSSAARGRLDHAILSGLEVSA